jgi:hypothetical protein
MLRRPRGEVDVHLYFYFNLGPRGGVKLSTKRPLLYTPKKKTRYPFYRRQVGPQGRSGRVRKVSPPPGLDPRTVQPVGSHYSEWRNADLLKNISTAFFSRDTHLCLEVRGTQNSNSPYPVALIFHYSRTSLTGLNGTASHSDLSVKIGYIGSLKFGCYCLRYLPASKPFDHVGFEVLEAITLCCIWYDNRQSKDKLV